ncbi:MAG: winged helix-turn-helix domain-containing protein [Actinomycetota bacterium]
MPAPFDLALAHAVAGETALEIDSLDRLSSLIDASLVSVTQGPEGATRYRLLDSIRAFGHEMLVECDDPDGIDDRYVDACVSFADQIVAEALEAFTPGVLGRIRDRFVHLAAAITRSLETDESPARAYRMFLPFYGPTGARTEVAELARRIRRRWDVSAPLEAEAWAVMGMSTFLAGDSDEAVTLCQEALAHPDGTALAKMISHRVLGFTAAQAHETEEARHHLQAAVDLARGFSESFARELLISWAAVSIDPAEAPASLEVLDEAAADAARNDEAVNVLWAALGSAFQHVLLDDLDAARRTVDAAVVIAERSGFPWSVGAAHRSMAGVLAMQEGWTPAAPHFRMALEVTVSVGDIEGAAVTLRAAAGAALHAGEQDLAHSIWATVPPRRGQSVIQSLFRTEEDRLIADLGPPTPIDLASSLARVRVLLGPGPDTADSAVPAAAPTPAGQTIRFGTCELDLAMQEVRRDGERVHVEPQVFDVLALLVSRRGTVVTKLELFDEVWGDRFVSESALSSRIMAARKAVGDSGRTQTVIRTVHGKGFTFIADVVV